MRTNGTFTYISASKAEFNEYGEPVQEEKEWSLPVYCSVQTVSDTRLGTYEDGVFRKASFSILSLDAADLSKAVRLRLSRHGEFLGEYAVISVERLVGMGRVKIIV